MELGKRYMEESLFVRLLKMWITYFALALVAAGAASLIYNEVTGRGPVQWGTVVVQAANSAFAWLIASMRPAFVKRCSGSSSPRRSDALGTPLTGIGVVTYEFQGGVAPISFFAGAFMSNEELTHPDQSSLFFHLTDHA